MATKLLVFSTLLFLVSFGISSGSSLSETATLGRGATAATPAWAEKMLLLQQAAAEADAVVAQDGSGDFTTITAAIKAAPRRGSSSRHIIRVRKGVYDEILRIPGDTWNLTLVGDGIGATVITGNRAVDDNYTMPETATVGVDAPGFMARDLTIQNTAGAMKNQAVALRSRSFRSIVYRCSLEGYQDTLYAEHGIHFYRDCQISGTVDFIYGEATAVFQNCLLMARLPRPGKQNVVTAQGRDGTTSSGFVFQSCKISGDPLLRGAAVETYLGRPWKMYSRVVFMENFISDIIHPLGYLPWNGSLGLDTLFYGEYSNYGPGSDVSGRVNWPGFHVIGATEAANFTVPRFIDGEEWLPGTGVEFKAGL